MFKKTITFIIIAASFFALFACGKTIEETSKLRVVTTLFPQYDFAKQIAGDKAQVSFLLPPGTESHSYEPSPKEMGEIAKADLFIYTGLNMENWADSLANNKNALDVSKNIAIGENNDPHIWTSPKNAKLMAKDIAEALIAIDSKNADYYNDNLQKYLAKLDELDTALTALPKDKQIIFGGRNAFYYLLENYNITALSAYDNCSEHSEPSAKVVADIIDTIKQDDIKVVYFEEGGNNGVAQTISDETGAQLLLLHTLHNPEKDRENPSYIGIMQENIANLKQGLM